MPVPSSTQANNNRRGQIKDDSADSKTITEKAAWKKLLSFLNSRDKTKDIWKKYNVDYIFHKNGYMKKVPILGIIVRNVLKYDRDAWVEFYDPTGEIFGSIDKEVIDSYPHVLTPGTALLLTKVTVYTSSPLNHHLIITTANIHQIYASTEINKSNPALASAKKSSPHVNTSHNTVPPTDIKPSNLFDNDTMQENEDIIKSSSDFGTKKNVETEMSRNIPQPIFAKPITPLKQSSTTAKSILPPKQSPPFNSKPTVNKPTSNVNTSKAVSIQSTAIPVPQLRQVEKGISVIKRSYQVMQEESHQKTATTETKEHEMIEKTNDLEKPIDEDDAPIIKKKKTTDATSSDLPSNFDKELSIPPQSISSVKATIHSSINTSSKTSSAVVTKANSNEDDDDDLPDIPVHLLKAPVSNKHVPSTRQTKSNHVMDAEEKDELVDFFAIPLSAATNDIQNSLPPSQPRKSETDVLDEFF